MKIYIIEAISDKKQRIKAFVADKDIDHAQVRMLEVLETQSEDTWIIKSAQEWNPKEPEVFFFI